MSQLSSFARAAMVACLSVLVFLPSQSSAQWKLLAQDMKSFSVASAALTYSAGKVWFISGKNCIGSVDDGITWESKTTPSFVSPADISSFDRATCLICDGRDIFITSDSGNTWSKIFSGFVSKAKFLGSPNTIIIIGITNVTLSRDRGKHWIDITPKNGMNFRDLNIRPSDNAIGVLTDDAFLFSTDEGVSWTGGLLGFTEECPNPEFTFGTCGYIYHFSFLNGHDHPPFLVYSSDNGKTFSKRAQSSFLFTGPIICTSTGTMFAQTGESTGGVMRSTDHGISWQSIGGPYGTGPHRKLICAKDDNTLFAFGLDSAMVIKKIPTVPLPLWGTYNSGGDSLIVSPHVDSGQFTFSSSKIINDSVGITVHLPLYIRHTDALSDVDMTMHYPAGPLQYLGGALVNGKSIDVAGSAWAGRARLHFDGSDLNALTDSLVGYVNFKWSPLEFDCATIDFDSITSPMIGDCSPQLLTAQPFKGIIGAYQWCGESAVVQSSQTDLRFAITPNPSRGILTVTSNVYSGPATITLADELGKTVLEAKQLVGLTATRIDASKLVARNYFLRIETPASTVTYSIKLLE